MPGVQEGRPVWCSPAGKWCLPAPSHATIKLLWNPADECCQFWTSFIQCSLIYTDLNCDNKKRANCWLKVAPGRLIIRGLDLWEEKARHRWWGSSSWPAPGFYSFTRAWSMDGHGKDILKDTSTGKWIVLMIREEKKHWNDLLWRKCDWTPCSAVADE